MSFIVFLCKNKSASTLKFNFFNFINFRIHILNDLRLKYILKEIYFLINYN